MALSSWHIKYFFAIKREENGTIPCKSFQLLLKERENAVLEAAEEEKKKTVLPCHFPSVKWQHSESACFLDAQRADKRLRIEKKNI